MTGNCDCCGTFAVALVPSADYELWMCPECDDALQTYISKPVAADC